MASEIAQPTPNDDDSQSVAIVQTQFVKLFEPPHVLTLEGGQRLGPVTVAYETYGTLTPEKDNAIIRASDNPKRGPTSPYLDGSSP